MILKFTNKIVKLNIQRERERELQREVEKRVLWFEVWQNPIAFERETIEAIGLHTEKKGTEIDEAKSYGVRVMELTTWIWESFGSLEEHFFWRNLFFEFIHYPSI
jgi:hypothetical protein